MATLLAAPASQPIPRVEDKLMANREISEYPDDGDPVAIKTAPTK